MARSNIFKRKESEFRLDKSRAFFMMRVVKHSNRLPREVVIFPSTEPFVVGFDGTVSNLILSKMFLPIAGGLD